MIDTEAPVIAVSPYVAGKVIKGMSTVRQLENTEVDESKVCCGRVLEQHSNVH